ncbi:MAG: S9 family peptidase [Maricaulaceae bacterium]|jgi:dipeptidyl aminopeptidase/acylaminoacyl peptidase
MRTIAVRFASATLALGAALAASLQAWAQPAPVEAYGGLPQVMDAAISPDGNLMILAMTLDDVSYFQIIDLNDGSQVRSAGMRDDDQLRGVGWAEDGVAALHYSRAFSPGQALPYYFRFYGSPDRVELSGVAVFDVEDGDIRPLTIDTSDPWRNLLGLRLVAPIEGDPGYGRIIGPGPELTSGHPGVYRVNLETGRGAYVRTRGANDDTLGFWLDPRGEVLLRLDADARSNAWSIHVYEGDEPRLLAEGVSPVGRPIEVEGALPDGRIAALHSAQAHRFDSLYAYDPATGDRELLFSAEGYDIDAGLVDPWTGLVLGAQWTEDDLHQTFFEPALQTAYEQAQAVFSDGEASLSSWSRDRRRIVVYAELGLDGGGYYLFTPAEGTMQRLAMRYPQVAEAQAGRRQAITYPARDGERIPAYLTLPDVAEAEDLPLVLLVHGGPHARDTFSFDWWSAFLASRGYAVLQPNYRGSTGYGRAWRNAGMREWGDGLMQTDVEDGAEALVRAGIADPERICIIGGSYGGYAALAGATITPEAYDCAVSVNGVSDLAELLAGAESGSEGRWSSTADFWRRSIGDRREDADHIRSISPASLAENVQIPILLLHGTDDTVVSIDHSRRMRDRLRAADKDVRYVELRGDDHWLSDAPTRIQMLTEIEAFLGEHIGAP